MADTSRTRAYPQLGMPDGFGRVAGVREQSARDGISGVAAVADAPVRRGRDISDELGIPSTAPDVSRTLSDAELEALDRKAEAEAEATLQLALEEETQKSTLGTLLRGLGRLYVAAGLAIATLFVLFAYSQTLQILAHLATQPDWIRYSGYAFLGVLGLALAFFVGRFAWTFARYRHHRQVSTSELNALSQRHALRELARRRSVEAVASLRLYLRNYDLDSRSAQQLLYRFGVDVRALRVAREWLLDDEHYASADAWIVEFRQRFQDRLDSAAAARMKTYALRVAASTAASPNGLVDSSIVLTSCFALFGDLCRIYNLRLGAMATVKLLGWSFTNAYLAGQLDEVADKLADTDMTWAANEGAGAVMQLAKPFVSKLAEGAANGLLIRRLGKQAIRLLQPVA
jgi:uncharacterized membrane protein YcjF (UPF0283 family)